MSAASAANVTKEDVIGMPRTDPPHASPAAGVTRVLEFVQTENYGFRRSDGATGDVGELVVWGGVVANCAEDALSAIVDGSAGALRRVTYAPDRTKGGALIRPKYHRGDRSGRAQFPQLEELTIRLEPVLLPAQYGWDTPALRRLRLLCVVSALQRSRDEGNRGRLDHRLPRRDALQAWLGVGSPLSGRGDAVGTLPQQLLHSCPQLESITVAVCSTAEPDRHEEDWLVLLPPRPVPWSIRRLLLLPLRKPAAGAGSPERSPLSDLPELPLQLVVACLERPAWQLQQRDLPEEVTERLGLPRGTSLEPLVPGRCGPPPPPGGGTRSAEGELDGA